MLAADVIFSFKYNEAKFTGSSFCSLSGKEGCAKMFLPLSSQQLVLSHPEGCHKQHLPSTGKDVNFGECENYVLQRKACTLKFSPFPPAFGQSHV